MKNVLVEMRREKGANNREKVSGNLEVYVCEAGSRGEEGKCQIVWRKKI